MCEPTVDVGVSCGGETVGRSQQMIQFHFGDEE